MTDMELRCLSRVELIRLLLEQTKIGGSYGRTLCSDAGGGPKKGRQLWRRQRITQESGRSPVSLHKKRKKEFQPAYSRTVGNGAEARAVPPPVFQRPAQYGLYLNCSGGYQRFDGDIVSSGSANLRQFYGADGQRGQHRGIRQGCRRGTGGPDQLLLPELCAGQARHRGVRRLGGRQ